jgi:hypothetical protein
MASKNVLVVVFQHHDHQTSIIMQLEVLDFFIFIHIFVVFINNFAKSYCHRLAKLTRQNHYVVIVVVVVVKFL